MGFDSKLAPHPTPVYHENEVMSSWSLMYSSPLKMHLNRQDQPTIARVLPPFSILYYTLGTVPVGDPWWHMPQDKAPHSPRYICNINGTSTIGVYTAVRYVYHCANSSARSWIWSRHWYRALLQCLHDWHYRAAGTLY